MIRYLTIALCALLTLQATAQKLALYDLSCDHQVNPIGIDNRVPRLSWKIKAEGRSVIQSAYEIRVATGTEFKKEQAVWTSGKVSSSQSTYLSYQGPDLKSGVRYYWQVRVWDNKKRESPWSAAAFWEMGLLSSEDWKAAWIEPAQDTVSSIPAIFCRKDFSLGKQVKSARIYITSHGLYELSLNGKKVGDQVLTPGWTSYNKRLQYQVYDVTSLLQNGDNTIGVTLGDGWYRGKMGWIATYGIWGKRLALLSQLVIRFTDGTEALVVSDKSWKSTSTGPIVMNGIYDGETYDARKELIGWNQAGYNATAWVAVREVSNSKESLIASESVPIKAIEEIVPKKIFRTPKGTLVADMGQNMVGWIRLKVKGAAGTTVTIRHAEVLDKYGEFYTENLRAAKATMTYTLRGSTTGEVYEPRFTFFGFRYVAIEGFPGEVKPENLTGVVVHSAMPSNGSFECSSPLVNQLQHNIVWGQKGNFVDVPTDCPQRDERLGWTGDAQAFCRTAAFNLDVSGFFSKWLKDVKADQLEDGKVPFVIPNALPTINATSAGWGDVATITPWTMYKVYGDKQFLEQQYSSMKAYVDYINKVSGDAHIWKGGSVFGDWLYFKPRMEDHTVPDGHTGHDMIATMFFAYSTNLLVNTAEVLGKKEDAMSYKALLGEIKDAFVKEYVTPSGRIASDSQTAYVLALMFDLLPESLRPRAVEYLVNDIKARGNHLSTGFLGTPYLCHVLSSNGQAKVGYDLLLQETYPSWLYPVKMGATTIWERWDGQKTDSTFQDKGMNSFNHYAYGAIGDWLYQVVAGIDALEPGYKKISIRPTLDDRMTFAKASYNSVYGVIVSGWKTQNGLLEFNITIPPNTTAVLDLPGATKLSDITYNGVPLTSRKDEFTSMKDDNGKVVLEVGSGTYLFNYKYGAH